MTNDTHNTKAVDLPGAHGANDTRRRRRRFRRDPASAGGARIELKRRDLDMITEVARHRFLNTEQVCRLFACNCPKLPRAAMRGGQAVTVLSKHHRPNCACVCGLTNPKAEHAEGCPALFKDDQHVGSRLRELYQAGFLERPIAQLQLRIKDGVGTLGSVPMVYSVTAAGLAIIGDERRQSLGAGKMSWAEKINEGGRVFMEHTLAIADLAVGIETAVREFDHLERLSETDLRKAMSEERRQSSRPFAMHAREQGEEIPVICDLAFAIGDKNARRRWNFLAEVDLGHMPIERSVMNRTSILRKLIGYAKAHGNRQHETEFGWRNFRVLILTTSQERVNSCIKAARKRFGNGKAGRIFLFATLDVHTDLLRARFLDIDGRQVRLIDHEPSLAIT